MSVIFTRNFGTDDRFQTKVFVSLSLHRIFSAFLQTMFWFDEWLLHCLRKKSNDWSTILKNAIIYLDWSGNDCWDTRHDRCLNQTNFGQYQQSTYAKIVKKYLKIHSFLSLRQIPNSKGNFCLLSIHIWCKELSSNRIRTFIDFKSVTHPIITTKIKNFKQKSKW